MCGQTKVAPAAKTSAKPIVEGSAVRIITQDAGSPHFFRAGSVGVVEEVLKPRTNGQARYYVKGVSPISGEDLYQVVYASDIEEAGQPTILA